MSLIYNNNNSKLTPLLETIFENKGGEPDQWLVSSRIIKERTEE